MTFARRIGIAAAIAILLPIGFALLSDVDHRATLGRLHRTDLDQRALNLTNHLERLVVDMETAIRGYRVNGDERFLAPDVAAVREYGPVVGELGAVTEDPAERRMIESIRKEIDVYRAGFANPAIEFGRAHPPRRVEGRIVMQEFPAGLTSDDGKRSMDSLRARFEDLKSLEGRRLSEDLRATARAESKLGLILWGTAGGFSLLFFAGTAALFRRYRRRASLLFAGIDAAGRGEYRAVSMEGEDEIARIAAAFNRMQQDVERRDEDLRRALDEAQYASVDLSTQQRILIETQRRILEGEERSRRDAEEAHRNAARLNAVLSSVGEGIYQLDVEGRVVYVNPAAERLLGYSIHEISGRNMHDLIHSRRPDGTSLPRESCRTLSVISTGVSIEIDEDHYQRRDGSFLVVEYTSTPIVVDDRVTGAVVSFQDISIRKQAEAELRRSRDELEDRVAERTADLERSNEALRASEGRYRLLFENNPQPMWVFDQETLEFLEINDAACRHYGYTREEFSTMTVKDIRPPEEVPVLLERIAAERGDPYQEAGTWRHRKKDGSVMEVEISSYAFRLGDRKVQLVLSSDVTHRRQLEEQLRQSQKMEAIGQLAGGIAHDFNNLLTAILGYAELAVDQTERDSPIFEDLTEIRKAGNRAASLTGQLLAFSRKQVVEPRVLDLNAVISDMDRMLRRILGERIDLLTVPSHPISHVKADPSQIEQIIMNLAVNARDAMPEGGKLTVETANVALDDIYASQHVGVTPGPFVMLAVSDTGEGMSPETRARIFEPFFTTKEKGKATGLGLSTVFGIVKQAGGHVWVYSEERRGTTFKIYLPATDQRLTPDEPSESVAPVADGHETILLVEDEAAVRRLARITLEKQGYRVVEAENGDEAIEKARANHDQRIDLFLSDAVMPGIDVASMVAILRASHPDARFLLMSGYTDEAVLRHGLLENGGFFLHKPFTSESLVRKVREALDSAGS